MAGFYGADVEQLRSLAQQLEQGAQGLDDAARLLGQQVMTATAWQGRDAEGFRSEWGGAHRGRITSAAGGLRQAAQAVRCNAEEQAGASRADGGGFGGGSRGPGGSGVVPPPAPDGVIEEDVWDLAERFRDLELPNGWKLWDLIELAGKVGNVDAIGLLSQLMTVGGALDSLIDGDLTLYEATDAIAVFMQLAPPLTPLHLGGNAIAIWAEAARLAEQSDFSPEGVELVVDYIFEDPIGAIEGAIDANIEYAPKMFNMILDIFK